MCYCSLCCFVLNARRYYTAFIFVTILPILLESGLQIKLVLSSFGDDFLNFYTCDLNVPMLKHEALIPAVKCSYNRLYCHKSWPNIVLEQQVFA